MLARPRTRCGGAGLSRIDPALFRELFASVARAGRTDAGWTRPPWSREVEDAEAAVTAAGSRSGLVASRDAARNLWLTDPDAPATGLVAAGSHLDTVPHGGAFDGALGVVAGVVAVAALRRAAVPGAKRLAVVAFADEEGWRFGTPVFGSRVLTGVYGSEVLERCDAGGARLGDVSGADPDAARGGHERLACFVEVHVEQGVGLAPAQVPLGVATGLAARSRLAWRCHGEANHAGTTPMSARSDALVTAARLVLAAQAAALAEPGAVATVGRIEVQPGGSNVIPGLVEGTLDVRAPLPAGRDRVIAAIESACPGATFSPLARDDGEPFDPGLRTALAEAARAVGAGSAELFSYAGHDAGALQAGGIASAMLFVRSPDGVSHHPSEHADEADCLLACEVLAEVLSRRCQAPVA